MLANITIKQIEQKKSTAENVSFANERTKVLTPVCQKADATETTTFYQYFSQSHHSSAIITAELHMIG